MYDTDGINNLYIRSKLTKLSEVSIDYTPKEFARDLAKLAYEADSTSAAITLQELERDRAITYFNKK